LNTPEILERQAAMAQAAGIEGFIFYFYWFSNRVRLFSMGCMAVSSGFQKLVSALEIASAAMRLWSAERV